MSGDRLTEHDLDLCIADLWRTGEPAQLYPNRPLDEHVADLPIPAPGGWAKRLMVEPATIHAPRTLREIDRDPRDWWSSAEAEAANEEWIREQFAADDDLPPPMSWADRLVLAIGIVAVLGLAAGWLG